MTNKERVAEIGDRLTVFRASPPNGAIDYAKAAGVLLHDMPYLLDRIAKLERLAKAVMSDIHVSQDRSATKEQRHQATSELLGALAACEEENAPVAE